jgi:Flp pilus assembly protein TadB
MGGREDGGDDLKPKRLLHAHREFRCRLIGVVVTHVLQKEKKSKEEKKKEKKDKKKKDKKKKKSKLSALEQEALNQQDFINKLGKSSKRMPLRACKEGNATSMRHCVFLFAYFSLAYFSLVSLFVSCSDVRKQPRKDGQV